ncbi:hypothetical protein BH11CYA1_BH11CYA1_43060 [soil metagenome]
MENSLHGAMSSFVFLRPYKKRIFIGVCTLLVLSSIISMLHDVEYTGQDISVRGPRIFAWLKGVVPPFCLRSIKTSLASNPEGPLFVHGLDSLRPEVIVQGAVYDCRFLATVASYTATAAGRQALYDSIKSNKNGSYSVTFPGNNETVCVSKLTDEERLLYAKTKDRSGRSAGIWLAVLEKAYGQYRNQHQDLLCQIRRAAKHIILEGRFTSDSRLPGFAAAYGATDDQAAQLLSARHLKELRAFSYECGDSGFGKDYVTLRQLSSWFNRDQVKRQFVCEQDAALRKASQSELLGIATTELNGDCEAYGLNPGHAYAVLSYNPDRCLLKLKDPFGRGDLCLANTKVALDGVDDGIFEIGLGDFNLLFSHLRLAQ